MEDRNPSRPGRVRLTPEDGSAPFYAKMERADEPTQTGTPLNKATFLKDSTAALYGLGATAVPDDVLKKLKSGGLTAADVGAVPTTRKVNNKALSGDITLTAADVGAVKVYRSLTELGLTEATATPKAIVDAMEDHSILLYSMSGTATTSALAAPRNYMLLTVTKKAVSYAEFTLRGHGADEIIGYYGYYNSGTANPWTGWKAPYSEGNKPTAEDMGAFAKSGNIAMDNADPIVYPTTASGATRVRLYSGRNAAYNGGAGLVLTNKDASENPGDFTITAHDGTTSSALNGKPDGTLTWKGIKVATTNTALMLDGSNAMTGALLFGSGYGRISAGASISSLMHLPTAGDLNNYKSIAVTANNGNGRDAMFCDKKDGVITYYDILHTGNLDALGSARVVTGSYVGTGTYGSDSPNSLTFDVLPKVIFIVPDCEGEWGHGAVLVQGASVFSGFGSFYHVGGSGTVYAPQINMTWGEKSVSWYTGRDNTAGTASVEAQQNVSGVTYRYIAFY